MSWGSGPWGSGPWGGGFPAPSGVITITSVRVISATYIRLNLSDFTVVDDLYSSESNFFIQVKSNTPIPGAPVAVVRVITPLDSIVVNYIYLETTPHTDGAFYEARYSSLHNIDGVSCSQASFTPYSSRVTKTMSTMKSLPMHFDRRPDSLVFNLIAAISQEDDNIGGSLNDEFVEE